MTIAKNLDNKKIALVKKINKLIFKNKDNNFFCLLSNNKKKKTLCYSI